MMFYPTIAIFCCAKCTAQLVQRTLVVDTPVQSNASKSQQDPQKLVRPFCVPKMEAKTHANAVRRRSKNQ
eukprot:12418883-Karenia_brevis.AAC.1